MIEISVIIPVKDDPRIKKCLNSVMNIRFPKNKYEVIVIDNGSKSYVKDIVKKFPVIYLHEKMLGSYSARNAGLNIARGKIIAFTDSDCVVDKNWLWDITSKFNNPLIAGVGGKIVKSDPKTKTQLNSDTLANGQKSLQYLTFSETPYIVTANAFFRASVIKGINGFDSSFKSGGDVDLSWRINFKGYKIITTDKSIVYHQDRKTLKGYFKQFFNYSVGHVMLFKKYNTRIGRKFYVNIYPLKDAFSQFKKIISNRNINMYSVCVIIVRDFAIICGNIYGAIKYKTLYI